MIATIAFLSNWGWMLAALVIAGCAIAWPAVVWKFKWQILLIAAVVVALLFRRDAAGAHAALKARDLEVAQAATKLSESARAAEQRDGYEKAAIGAAYEKGITDGKAKVDAVRAGVADGTLVLRDKFKCPTPRVLPDAGATAGSSDGEAGSVLSAADVDFLVQLSGEADAVARQLQACQAVVLSDQAPLP